MSMCHIKRLSRVIIKLIISVTSIQINGTSVEVPAWVTEYKLGYQLGKKKKSLDTE